LGEAYLTALNEMRVNDHSDVLCPWDIKAGQEVMAIVNLFDGVPLYVQPIHHAPELIDVGEARQISVVRSGHHKEVGLGSIPWEYSPG
jgi:hypothetical protein